MDLFNTAVTFLVGVSVGSAGTYFGNKYTDIRRNKEDKSKRKKFYKELWKQHKPLLSEMRDDLKSENSQYIRKFYVLSKGLSYNLEKGNHLYYYIEDHEQLLAQLDVFLANGLIFDLTESKRHANKYQFSEDFIEFLLNT